MTSIAQPVTHVGEVTERHLPGSAVQMARDAATFFDSDLPGLLDCSSGQPMPRASRVRCCTWGGTDSGPWFAEVRELMLEWLPGASTTR